jgi:type 1 fimbria pilin
MLLTACLLVCTSSQARDSKPIAQPRNEIPDVAQIHFVGGLLSTPCALSVDSAFQRVDLGQLSAKSFREVGDRSADVTFTLRFQDCLMGAHAFEDGIDSTRYSGDNSFVTGEQVVAFSFAGETDIANPNLLKLNGARGVGIRLSDARGTQIPLNRVMRNQYLNAGNNELRFSANLEATQRFVMADAFDAVVNVNVYYF